MTFRAGQNHQGHQRQVSRSDEGGSLSIHRRLTGKDVRAAEVAAVPFPTLLEPIDDLPPVTVITSVRREGNRLRISGVTADNGEIASISVNGRSVTRFSYAAGVTDWEIVLSPPANGILTAKSDG